MLAALPPPAVDRTQEFHRLVSELQPGPSSQQPPPPPPPVDSRPSRSAASEFSATAAQIGADIYACAERLGKLTRLAQSRSLFDEAAQANEINELTLVIKEDITQLNAKIGQLQAHQAHARSQRDQRASHSSNVVDSLKAALADTTIGFKDVLQTRSHNMKLLQERRQQFKSEPCGGGVSSSMHAVATPGFDSFSDAAPPASIFECVSTDGAGPSWASPGAKPRRSANGAGSGEVVIEMEQLQTQQLVPAEYLEQRAQAVDSVTRTIAELGSIYQQLATLVAEQGTMLQRIDVNVEDSLASVEAGHEELQKFWRGLSSNRGLMVRVFAILLFFVVLWGAFLA
ncbi:hypothetical protein AB1Y20_012632 [Prymnesium parvum]|uniref:t-SNARE coiled-coil homology domain-containing protein n=1 Tax=Prymnesium parvum TaxID=97485 RepID=A0AB34IL91_PRYPA|mmetsp:Transcript_18403/g.46090  ORF Transcript_18403/g.46090 Transcript_18403/m.46090 type:complete len:342 (+) Transcript_18403:22-1047(+)